MSYTPTAKTLMKLRKAIKSYNSAIDRMAKSGKFDYLPLKTNIVQELEFIENSKQMNTRIKQLRRILTTEKNDAQDIVRVWNVNTGEVGFAPKYLQDEIKYITRDINSTRKALRESLYPEWDTFSPQQQAAALSNRNLVELDPEDYIDGMDLKDLLDEQYSSVMKKADVYISVWQDFNGNPEIPGMIREMAENDPDGFKRLMESADIEKEIEYVYGDVGAGGTTYTGRSGYKYNRVSAFRGSMINRYSSAEEYWIEQYNDYQTKQGYFA